MDNTTARAAINRVVDPCSAARGVPIGLTDMGLVRSVRIEEADDRTVEVTVTFRVTSPGCMLGMEFGRRATQELRDAGADRVKIEWDTTFDWTEEAMAPEARDRLHTRRRQLQLVVLDNAGPGQESTSAEHSRCAG